MKSGEKMESRAGGAGRPQKTQVRIAGFGGQGIVLAGAILGKAAALFEGLNAVMTQSYGPEARGGACSADVVISPGPIHYPKVTHPDILALMSEEAARTYGASLAGGGILLVNENLVKTLPGGKARGKGPGEHPRVLKVPATEIATKLGKTLTANIVMLGFIAAVTGIVSRESMERAVLDSIPKGSEELNLAAFRAGYDHGRAEAAGDGHVPAVADSSKS
jgi:2-oxoglutarate ferredoxin oxidoreductase subunit gamma